MRIQTLALFVLNDVPAKARRMKKPTLLLANPPPREKAPINNEPMIKQAPVDDNCHYSQIMGTGNVELQDTARDALHPWNIEGAIMDEYSLEL